MNNPKSMILGWVCLTGAALVSFTYAKKNINERRQAQEVAGQRPSEKLDWRERVERDEKLDKPSTTTEGSSSSNSASSLGGGPS